MEMGDAVRICKALGDPNRMRIVQMLTRGECCACQLLEELAIAQPTLSHHMKQLEEAGLVRTRKDWKWSHYSLNDETLEAYRRFVAGLCNGRSGDGIAEGGEP